MRSKDRPSKRSTLCGFLGVCCAIGLASTVLPPRAAVATEYFLDVDHPSASDSNTGLSADRPLKTLSGSTRALQPGDVLTIGAGIYRESLVLTESGTPTQPIVIRAKPDATGEVVIRGSDLIDDWSNDGGRVWSVAWVALPLIEYPAGWPDYGEHSQRREMVFVDGVRLKQVFSSSALADGRFWMDDGAQRLRIHIVGNPNQRRVEISTRSRGIFAPGQHHVIRGITVQHVTTDIWTAAMHLGENHRVEKCTVEHNNGVGIKAYSGLVLKETRSNHNGRLGIGLNGSGSLLEANETSHNSWRYGPRWEAGGVKILGGKPSNNRILRHVSNFNNGIGVWFDTTGSGNVVEASFFRENTFGAIEFEAAAGPNWAVNNIVIGTRKADAQNDNAIDGAGIIIYDSSHTNIYNNTVVGVEGPGIAIAGNHRDHGDLFVSHTSVINNIISESGRAAVSFEWLSGSALLESRVESHQFDHNLYHSNPIVVIFPNLRTTYGTLRWTLSQWQANHRQDVNSLNKNPEFSNPDANIYSLLSTSPAVDNGKDLTEVTHDFNAKSRPHGRQTDIGACEYYGARHDPPAEPGEIQQSAIKNPPVGTLHPALSPVDPPQPSPGSRR